MLPLHAHDDYPYHQAIAPMGVPTTSDPRFNDGYYFACYRPGRHVFAGLRFHPNNNVVDGYAGAVAGGEQRGLRMSRALDADRVSLAVGPLRLEVIDPMRVQRLVCEPHEYGVGFDVTFTASCPAFVETPHVQYRYGRVLNHVLRYTQPVRARGVLVLDGVEEEVDDWFGARDHSWGIRQTMGPTLPVRGAGAAAPDPRALRLWVPFEYGDRAGFFHLHEDVHGGVLDCEGRLESTDGSGRSWAIVAVDHRLEMREGTARLAAASFALHLEDGSIERFQVNITNDPAHPQGFGYTRGWSDGGNPGVWRGVEYAEGERFDVSDATVRQGPPHTDEQRRLGGTEFTGEVVDGGRPIGMAHVEYMRYV